MCVSPKSINFCHQITSSDADQLFSLIACDCNRTVQTEIYNYCLHFHLHRCDFHWQSTENDKYLFPSVGMFPELQLSTVADGQQCT